MGMYRCVWVCMGMYGHLQINRVCFVVYGYVWVYMGM